MRFRSMQTGLKIGQDHQIVEVLQSSWSLSLLAYRANSLYTWTFNWYCKFGSEILGLQVPEKVQTQKPRKTTLKSRSQPMWSRMLLLRVSHFLFLLLRSLGDIWDSLGIRALVWGYVRSLCGYLRSNLQSKKIEFPCVWLSSLQPVYNRKSNKNNDDLGVPRFSNISHLHADGIHAKIVAVQRARLDLLRGNVGTSKN